MMRRSPQYVCFAACLQTMRAFLKPRCAAQRRLTLLGICVGALAVGCTDLSAPPKGMSEVATPPALGHTVVGGSAVQTGAPGAQAPSRGDAGQSAAPAADAQALATEIYLQRCVLCHGPKGQGNGVAAVNLKPKPRDLHDKAWHSATSDQAIAAIIVQGGAGVGRSMMMPPNPDLAHQPGVVDGLVAIVRSFNN